MDFLEAESRFRWLENQLATGAMTEAQYRAAMNVLRVTDQNGRLWMMQERTGRWYVYLDNQWLAAEPPITRPTAPPPPLATPVYASAPATAHRSAPRAQPRPQQQSQEKRGGCAGKFLLYLFIWAVVWIVIAIVLYFVAAKDEPMALLGVGAAALLSLILMLASLSSSWEGTIIDLRTERVRVQDDDDSHWERQTFAYIQQPNGRRRKMRAMPGWEVGMHLEKRRGEYQIRAG